MAFLARKSIRYLTLVSVVVVTVVFFSSRYSNHSKSAKIKTTQLFDYVSSSKEYGIKYNQKLMGTSNSDTKSSKDKDTDDRMTWEEIQAALAFDRTPYSNIGDIVEENMDFYREVFSKKITEPKFAKLTYNGVTDEQGAKKVLTKDEYPRANATLLTLVRNQELKDIIHTIRQIETHWNHNFHYPYTFINDEEFTEEFKQTIKRHTPSDLFFEVIPPEIWNKPGNIDPEREKKNIERLTSEGVQYIDKDSYHNMCRFNSGYFYQLEGLKKFRWYWRFEPATDYYCTVDYDIFKFMEDNNKTYGFTISLYDNPLTVETLWPVTADFVEKNPQYVNPNGAFKWLTENVQQPEYNKITGGYSTCHFWSNFEVGDMDFYRGEAYSKWMEALDEAGGFYYERWGDAPVHSVGLGLFEDKSKIHWFRDIGYHHSPYKNIPNSDKCQAPEDSGYFAPEDVYDQNCLSNWIRLEMTHKELQEY